MKKQIFFHKIDRSRIIIDFYSVFYMQGGVGSYLILFFITSLGATISPESAEFFKEWVLLLFVCGVAIVWSIFSYTILLKRLGIMYDTTLMRKVRISLEQRIFL